MFMTANPCADAERWNDEQDRRERAMEQSKAKAAEIVRKALEATTPESWFKDMQVGGVYTSPWTMLLEAIGDSDEATQAMGQRLSSPEAKELREAVITFQAENFHRAINYDL